MVEYGPSVVYDVRIYCILILREPSGVSIPGRILTFLLKLCGHHLRMEIHLWANSRTQWNVYISGIRSHPWKNCIRVTFERCCPWKYVITMPVPQSDTINRGTCYSLPYFSLTCYFDCLIFYASRLVLINIFFFFPIYLFSLILFIIPNPPFINFKLWENNKTSGSKCPAALENLATMTVVKGFPEHGVLRIPGWDRSYVNKTKLLRKWTPMLNILTYNARTLMQDERLLQMENALKEISKCDRGIWSEINGWGYRGTGKRYILSLWSY